LLSKLIQEQVQSGNISLHGEGETDGKKRIQFSSPNETERRRYILESVSLYSLVLESFDINRVQRIILHPDTFSHKVSRKKQIASLVTSLLEIRDKLKHTFEYVCIEPRGGDRQKKVLRVEIEDIICSTYCTLTMRVHQTSDFA